MPSPLMALEEVAPITQRRASRRLDLPQPLGPTTPVRPGSMRNSVGSTKDLKPERRSRWNCTGSLGARGFDGRAQHVQGHFAFRQLVAVDDEGWRAVDPVG